jgi:quercetin dioxygenase-like cupin family protein
MTAGTEVRDHRAHGSAILQTLRGQVTVSLTDTELQLQPGQLVALARQVPHWLRADVDSVALLVVTADPT